MHYLSEHGALKRIYKASNPFTGAGRIGRKSLVVAGWGRGEKSRDYLLWENIPKPAYSNADNICIAWKAILFFSMLPLYFLEILEMWTFSESQIRKCLLKRSLFYFFTLTSVGQRGCPLYSLDLALDVLGLFLKSQRIKRHFHHWGCPNLSSESGSSIWVRTFNLFFRL